MTIRMLFSLPAFLFIALPARALDIVYQDHTTKKDIKVLRADLDESTEGIVIKKGAPTMGVKLTFPVKVSPMDVRDVQWSEDDVKPIDFLTYRKPFARVDRAALPATKDADRLQLMKDSLPDFKELIKNIPPAAIRLKRHVEFRHAQTLWQLSLADDTFREQATKALDEYAQKHQASWQITPTLMMLARLQGDQGDLAAMQKTYEALAAVPGLSEEIRTTSLIKAAEVLMKTENFAGAQEKLTELKGKLPADGALAGKVALYLSQCHLLGNDAAKAQAAEKELRAFLSKTEDKALKALAHNTLGDYYVKLKRDEDAFWEYLRVDTLYSDDRFEHARAIYHLIRLFRDVKKDADRSLQYEEILKTDKRFAGMEYQKKAMMK